MQTFLQQYRGKNASIDEFEKLATSMSQDNLRYFFAQWVEGTGAPEFTVDYQIIRTRSGKFRIVFTGVMSYAPNVSAATFLARGVLRR